MKNKPSLLDIELFNKDRDKESKQELAQIDEDSEESETRETTESEAMLTSTIDRQKSVIKKISTDMRKMVEQIRKYKLSVIRQKKEIDLLKKERPPKENQKGAVKKPTPNESDTSYNYNLILQNIVMLIEEKGFSTNDVARLFKAEGFLPPSPYTEWDIRAIDQLYLKARQ
ncbi:MAG: hypothetical protein GY786_13690 [Proteobacteria bacterium]|nr:hypothetical protein [Pseudomonadota bacterium]